MNKTIIKYRFEVRRQCEKNIFNNQISINYVCLRGMPDSVFGVADSILKYTKAELL